jgi:hypothetical protein
MVRLLKPYNPDDSQKHLSVREWPPCSPGDGMLPLECSLNRGILEAIVAAGDSGLTSEVLQKMFSMSSKCWAIVLKRLSVGYKVWHAKL